jgi:flagellar biosynthetic protein FliR
MGLSFASFFDPQSQGQSNSISQFLLLLATLAFLAVNGHLLLLSALAHSFATLPISASPMDGHIFKQIADWGGIIFSAGVQLSLPMVAALLITNIALGILTRAAPQLNLFGIGFPITLTVGFVVIGFALPYLATPLESLFQQGIEMSGKIVSGAAGIH